MSKLLPYQKQLPQYAESLIDGFSISHPFVPYSREFDYRYKIYIFREIELEPLFLSRVTTC